MKTALISLKVCMVLMVCLFIWGLYVTLKDDVKEWCKKKYDAHKEKREIVKKAKTSQSVKNPYIEKFYEARSRGDSLAMEHALLECRNNCKQANGYCLTEIFCPECPFGDMPVMSGRQGMSL